MKKLKSKIKDLITSDVNMKRTDQIILIIKK